MTNFPCEVPRETVSFLSTFELNRISEDKLVWYGDDRVSEAQNNVYPTYKDNIVPEQIGQAQFNWDQSQQSKYSALPRYFAYLIRRAPYCIVIT